VLKETKHLEKMIFKHACI